jgi:hypothetical protein
VDRFYRNLQGLLGALDRLNQAGVGFVSITENPDFTTPWGKLTLAVLGTLAEIYVDKLSAETSKDKTDSCPQGTVQRQYSLWLLRGQMLRLQRSQRPGLLPQVRRDKSERPGAETASVAASGREHGHTAGLRVVQHWRVFLRGHRTAAESAQASSS